MGFATVTDLDELEWLVWPKTPTFLYFDVNDGVRIQKDTLKQSMGQKQIYTVVVDYDCPCGKGVIRQLTKSQVAFELAQINKWLPCLPLTRKNPYEAVALIEM